MKRVVNLIRCAALTVAVAVATLLVAFSSAEAHPGHRHDPVASAKPAPVIEMGVQQDTGRELFATPDADAPNADTHATRAASTVSHVASLQAGSGNEPANGCSHGCAHCQCAPCSQSHSALPAAHEMTPAPSLATPLMAAVLAQPGIEPGALPEPPKSLIR